MSINIKNLTYRINSNTILDDINFEVQSGEIISILGPNGAGKSTLLKLIAGDFNPTSGKILFNDENLLNISIKKRARIRSVMSSPIDFPFNYKVIDILEMGCLDKFKINEDRFSQKFEKTIRECNISKMINRNYNSLSSGEKRRVNLARAIIQVSNNKENKFILLDEPTENLDPFYEKRMMDIIKKKKFENYGIIMVQHNLNLALQFSDKILLIKEGKKLDFGEKEFIMTEKNLIKLYEIPIFVNDNFINIKYNS